MLERLRKYTDRIATIPGSGRISDPAETRVYSRPSVDRIVGMYEDMYVNLFTRSYLLILRVLGILLRYRIHSRTLVGSLVVSFRVSQSRRLLAKVSATDWQTGD